MFLKKTSRAMTATILVVTMTSLGFLSYVLGWLTPQQKFSSADWKQAKDAKNYSIMRSMTKDLSTMIIGLKESEALAMLGDPDLKGHNGIDGTNYAYYQIETPGSLTKSIVIVSSKSKVVNAFIHPSDIDAFFIRLFPGL